MFILTIGNIWTMVPGKNRGANIIYHEVLQYIKKIEKF